MTTFSSELEAFGDGNLPLEALVRALDARLSESSVSITGLITELQQFHNEHTLPDHVFRLLSLRLQNTDDATTDSHMAKTVVHFGPSPDAKKFEPEAPTRIISGEIDAAVDSHRHRADAPTRIVNPESISETSSPPPSSRDAKTVIADSATVVTPQRKTVDTSRQRSLKPGSVIKERFVLEEVLGTGGMGVVYKARDIRKEEAHDENPYIAIKVLGEEFKAHAAAFKVLQRETQKAQSLAHPNIITVYDFDRDGNTIYMTMEQLIGTTLDSVVKNAQPQGMPVRKALPFIEGIVQALAYAHKKQIIHSDLKPGNVFHTQDNVVKVLDFGIARALKQGEEKKPGTDEQESISALTPAYASCEMLEGQEPDARDDIYALACITYELLAGAHPFNRKPAVEARDAGMKPAQIKGLKRRQWAALNRGLAFEREDRTADVLTFLNSFKPTKRLRGQTIVLTLMLLSLGGYYIYERGQDDLPPPVELTEQQKAQIVDLHEVADFYMAAGFLAAPPGDSGYDIYKRILEIDPRDQGARKGIAQIADRYEELARAAIKDKDDNMAREYIALGLGVDPNHNKLQSLDKILREN
ncbi:MAG: protein kinase [Gammaproteobacteria bacterium]|nr:protein kinase [Gammaproteobacteria bacterium]MDH3465221.1 protein kinase [Gammaproteobacteria bacterium]